VRRYKQIAGKHVKDLKIRDNIHKEFKVFGFTDSNCELDRFELKSATTECSKQESGSLRLCRPWLLTDIVDRAEEGMSESLTWCEETGGRTFSLMDGIEYIIDNLDWPVIEGILTSVGYDREWLEQRWEQFELWIQIMYFDMSDLEEIYVEAETDIKFDNEKKETEEWLMHNHD
jgi:hypothetical protein